MSDFVRIANVDDVPNPGKIIVQIEDRLIGLFHVDGRFYALEDVCTHDDGPLAEGELQGYEIICPRHGARFDIRDGRALTMPATRPTASHEVKVENGGVFVKLND